MRYTVTTTDRDDVLGLREFAERALNGMWVPEDLMPEDAAAFALDALRDAIQAGLRGLQVTCEAEADSCLQVGPPA